MKKLFLMLMVVAGTTAMMTSCKKTCDSGYEGDGCKTEVRGKFLSNNYSVSESKNGGTAYTYAATIVSSSEILSVSLTNVANGFFNSNVKATVSGTSLTIADQTPDADDYHIQGNGSIADGVLTLTYTITGPNGLGVTVTDSYNSTWTQQ